MAQNSMSPSVLSPTPMTPEQTPSWVKQMDGITQSTSFRQMLILVALAATVAFMVGFFCGGKSRV